MKIGLVDIDGHAKKKKWGATIYPNLALCKIARYHKMRGDAVEWAIPFYHYDIVYKSKVFNFSTDDLTAYDADQIIKGGTGYDITSQLPDEIDRMQPDYSIYPHIPSDTAYGFLTRGCPNKCPWCVVPRKEGVIRQYMDVDEIAIEGRKKLVLMDNNILAAGNYAVEQLEKIIDRGYKVDFNQALDARLVTDQYARLLARIKWIDRRIRFGCDTKGQIAECERAISLIQGYGYKGEFFLYTMIGGKSDFKESYERVHYWWVRNHECREKHLPNIYPYAQPYRDPDNPNFTPPYGKRIWRNGLTSIRYFRWSTSRTLSQGKDLSAVNISIDSMMTKIIVDLMTGRDDRYIATLRIEPALNMIQGYFRDKPVISVEKLCREIEDRRPTLRGSDYKVLPCNDNYILNYD